MKKAILRVLAAAIAGAIAAAMTAVSLVGCGAGQGTDVTTAPDATAAADTAEPAELEEPVTLIIAGSWPDCRGIEAVGQRFTEKYPNCTVVYEYLQNYYDSLAKRMSGEETVDIFFTTNIQKDSALLPYAFDLYGLGGLDLSGTFGGLIDNFIYRDDTAEKTDKQTLYAIPLGAEIRGMYINKTLLDSLNIKLPTDQKSVLEACEVLKKNGYIAFQGNPGNFGQLLLYPWFCNLIANADDPAAAYAKVAKREAGVSELFREPMSFLYTLTENGYYDYKTSQTDFDLFNDMANEDYARYLLNIHKKGDTYEKIDDVGNVAFMPTVLSLGSVISKMKDDYHSKIEYVFVPSPIGEDGGFAYLSPAHGIAANKTSPDVDWSVKFLDFLFERENIRIFSELYGIIPNTSEAFDYIDSLYDIPDDRISQLGQVTFDYSFYSLVTSCLVEASKANNPKYMKTADDGTQSLYPLDYYMAKLETALTTK